MAWTINGASTHARQLVAVFQVLCSLYRLTCVATLKTLFNSSHVLLWYTWSPGAFAFTQTALFAQIGDSNDKCSSIVGGWMLKRRRNARCTAVADSVFNVQLKIFNYYRQKFVYTVEQNAKNVTRMGGRRGIYMILVGKPGGRGTLERPRGRWKDSINSLNSKLRLLYLKTQFVPRSKHFSSRL